MQQYLQSRAQSQWPRYQVRRLGNGINIKRLDWLFMITRTESYLGMTTAD